jgi:hypothetical protein
MSRYKESIIQKGTERCYLCGNFQNLEVHHVMNGPYRAKSTEDGLIVRLCHWCHRTAPNSAHRSRQTAWKLKQDAQKAYMKKHTLTDWMKRYGRNYL